jgi:hypothetical protein
MRPDTGAGRKRTRDRGGESRTNQHPPLGTTSSCTTVVTPTSDDGADALHCYDEEEAEDVEHYQEEVVAVGRAGAHLEPTAVLEYLMYAAMTHSEAFQTHTFSHSIGLPLAFHAASQLYVKELWGINPINPATTDIETLRTGVGSEEGSSSLTLASCLLMSSSCVLFSLSRTGLVD